MMEMEHGIEEWAHEPEHLRGLHDHYFADSEKTTRCETEGLKHVKRSHLA